MRAGLLLLATALLAIGAPLLAVSEEAQGSSSDHAGGNPTQEPVAKPVLVFIKLRPSKTRSKADVVAASKKWLPTAWGASGDAELSVIDNDAAVMTSASMEDAIKAKDWLLKQQLVYEVELSKGGEVFRRQGDIPLEELRRGLSRNAQQERREKGWQWLRRTAKQQGVKIKRPRRRRGTAGGWRAAGGHGTAARGQAGAVRPRC